jgi:hypothetical protein
MKRPPNSSQISAFRFLAIVLQVAWVIPPAFAQQDQSYSGGVVDNWSHRHIIYSNSGTLEDAEKNGNRKNWHRIVSDPRYRMQWIRRNVTWTEQTTTPTFSFPAAPETDPRIVNLDGRKRKDWDRRGRSEPSPYVDWSMTLSETSNVAIAPDMYPAKYTFGGIVQ